MLSHKKGFGEIQRECENKIQFCMLYSRCLVDWIKHVKMFLSEIKEQEIKNAV